MTSELRMLQALSWLGRRFAWSHPSSSQHKQPARGPISIQVSSEALPKQHGSSPSLTQLHDAAMQTEAEALEPSPRRRSESDCRRRRLPPLPMEHLPQMPES